MALLIKLLKLLQCLDLLALNRCSRYMCELCVSNEINFVRDPARFCVWVTCIFIKLSPSHDLPNALLNIKLCRMNGNARRLVDCGKKIRGMSTIVFEIHVSTLSSPGSISLLFNS